MGPKADPLTTPEVIKPEWFFYVSFRWLKLFSLTFAVLSTGFIVAAMFVWPWIDKFLRRITGIEEISVYIGIVATFLLIGLDRLGSGRRTLQGLRCHDHSHQTNHHRPAQRRVHRLADLRAVDGSRPQAARRRASACGTCRFRPVPSRASSAISKSSPGIIDHWKGSTHAVKGVGCVECHQAEKGDADAFDHYGALIATVVTPRDCGRCHKTETDEFMASHHAKAGNILASLDNFLAETVEGSRSPVQSAFAHAGPRCHDGQWHGVRRYRLQAVPRQQGRPGSDRRQPDHGR